MVYSYSSPSPLQSELVVVDREGLSVSDEVPKSCRGSCLPL